MNLHKCFAHIKMSLYGISMYTKYNIITVLYIFMHDKYYWISKAIHVIFMLQL